MNQDSPARTFRFLPLSIRLETLGGVATPLVLRGTPLPAKRSEIFSTAADNQATVEVSLWLGERPLAKDNLKIGTFQLTGIKPAARGVPQIHVEFAVDSQCAVTARAKVQGTDLQAEQEFRVPLDLSDDTIASILTEAEAARAEDEAQLRHLEAINRANTLVSRAETKLSSGSDKALSEAVAALGLALASGNVDAIREKSDALEERLSPTPDIFGADLFKTFFERPASARTRSSQQVKSATTAATNRAAQGLTSQPYPHQLGRIFGGGSFTLDPQLCFVLMPFGDKLQPIFEDHIRPTVEKAGLRCERADDIRGTSLITWDIWERINRARFVIADLTDLNANVFYELGLAHAISKDAILLTQSMNFVPFDLRALRCVLYDSTHRGTQKLESALAATIQELMKSG